MASEAVCARCGRFCCGPCLGERQPLLCLACVPLALDPLGLRSARFDPVSALIPGLRLAAGVAAPVLVICLLFSVPAALRSQEADPLARSEALVRGRFWEVFAFLLLAGAVLYLPAFVAIFGLGLLGELVAIPTFATEVFGDLLERVVSDGLMGGVMLAAYVQLHGGSGVALAPMRWRAPPAPISSTAGT